MYKEMYYHLFNAVTDAIENDNIDEIKKILIKGQQETEEMYISAVDDNIIKLNSHL